MSTVEAREPDETPIDADPGEMSVSLATNWRAQLGRLVDPGSQVLALGTATGDESDSGSPAELALQFELRELILRTASSEVRARAWQWDLSTRDEASASYATRLGPWKPDLVKHRPPGRAPRP